jgi:hypothetical protein
MIFVFGFVIGIGFTLTALFTMMLSAAAQFDQALDPEFALAWWEAKAASIDGPHQGAGGGERADLVALAAAPNR